MGLSELQNKILNIDKDKIIVNAASASGKTYLLVEKTLQIIDSGVPKDKIAVITFTALAASELKERLGDKARGIFVGTIHSLANKFLMYAGIQTQEYIDNENFDRFFELIEENPDCIQEIDYLLLDEAQDTSRDQYNFIFNMIKPKKFFICLDYKQSIYQWRDAMPILFQFLEEEEDVYSCSLNENYRNGSKILNFAKRLIKPTGLIDDSIAIRKESGAVVEREFTNNEVAKGIKEKGNYKDWAVLCRTNSEIADFEKIFQTLNIPYTTFKQGGLTLSELSSLLNGDKVKLLTIHSSKGLEFPYVAVVGARFSTNEERNLCYVAATRAKDLLVWVIPKRFKRRTISSNSKMVSWS